MAKKLKVEVLDIMSTCFVRRLHIHGSIKFCKKIAFRKIAHNMTYESKYDFALIQEGVNWIFKIFLHN